MNKLNQKRGPAVKHPEQDSYYRASNGREYHRCTNCWVLVAKVDNGFSPIEQPYPHFKYCKNKGLF